LTERSSPAVFLRQNVTDEARRWGGELTRHERLEILESRPEGRRDAMPQDSHGRFENVGRKLDEQFGGLSDKMEEEVRKVVDFLNDRVVPEVRQNSSKALRVAAEQLSRLAEHLESRRGQ
jgi:hypothetical protein